MTNTISMNDMKRITNLLRNIYGCNRLYYEIESPFFSGWDVIRSTRRLLTVAKKLDELKNNGVLMGNEVLDIGCSTGRLSRELSRHGFNVLGIDTDRMAIKAAIFLEKIFDTGTRYCTIDYSSLDFSKFDVICILSHMFNYFDDLDVLNSLLEKLSSFDGVIVMDLPAIDGSDGCCSNVTINSIMERYEFYFSNKTIIKLGKFRDSIYSGRELVCYLPSNSKSYSSDKPNVWILNQTLGLGGAERVSVLWGESIMDSANVSYFCSIEGNGVFSDRVRKFANIYSHYSPDKVLEKARHVNPDLLIFNIAKDYISLIPKIRSYVKNIAFVVHSSNQWTDQFFANGLSTLYDYVIVVGEHQLSYPSQFGIDESKIYLLRNPVDVTFKRKDNLQSRYNLGLTKDVFAFGYAGRACGGKRTSLLPKILKSILDVGVNAKLVVCGMTEAGLGQHSDYWNSWYDDFNNTANSLGVSNHIVHIPTKEDISEFYSAMDAIVLTSEAEGSPLMPLEAISCGTPVISTNVGDVSRYLTSDIGCFVVDNNPECFIDVGYDLLLLNARIENERESFSKEMIKYVNSVGITYDWWIPNAKHLFHGFVK